MISLLSYVLAFPQQIVELKRLQLGINPMRGTINEGVITLVDSLKRTVLAIDVSSMEIVGSFSGFSYPLWALHVGGRWYVTDYFTGKFQEIDRYGKTIREILLGGSPTTFLYVNDVFYICLFSNGTVVGVERSSFRVVERYPVGIPSTYLFPLKKGGIAYMCYWKNEGEPDLVYLRRGMMEEKKLGLTRPLFYLEGSTGDYVLDYRYGILVKLTNGGEAWRVNLPDFAYGISFYGSDIAVSSLLSPVVSVVDRDGNVRQIEVPHPVLTLEEFGNRLVALSNEGEEIYLIEKDRIVAVVKTGKYPLKLFKISEDTFAVLCTDSGELIFYRIL